MSQTHYEILLCSACRTLTRLGYDFDENPELSEWWFNHQEQDRKMMEEIKRRQDREEAEEKELYAKLKAKYENTSD